MTPVQLALLVVAVGAGLLIFFISRRNNRGLKDWNPDGDDSGLPRRKAQQLDMFAQGGQFDEFGVSTTVRKKVDPSMDAATSSPAPKSVPPKTIGLLIAEREGTQILGMKVHGALKAHGLVFGEGEIYHRMVNGMSMFSVGSILKPGTLNPAESARFSTPGLSMFLNLPGPVPAMSAFRDFVAAARSLSVALNSDVFDLRKKPLTPESLAELEREVEAWARANSVP